ncbi:hypothetical protein P43SY_007695 [Pythium insidiosum]|uniref:Myb-like domain-containing protein n=1 Tax=Pythium insidiosum TaxID=114742 RepID=A0AAD5LYJ1_PYTIN|nr:hypothetical protein P43SY_007695 [Pythium insidiosum]
MDLLQSLLMLADDRAMHSPRRDRRHSRARTQSSMALLTTSLLDGPPFGAHADAPAPTGDDVKYRTRLATGASAPLRIAAPSPASHRLRALKKAPVIATTTTSSSSRSPSLASSKQRKYERKTKRFIWPEELHRLFVAAIFDVGLKNASPKALLTIMMAGGATSDLTTEHLKSHLQKYRLNYERSRLEFLEMYDESSRRTLKRRRRSGDDVHSGFVFPITGISGADDVTSESGHDSDSSDDKRPSTPVEASPREQDGRRRPDTDRCSQQSQPARTVKQEQQTPPAQTSRAPRHASPHDARSTNPCPAAPPVPIRPAPPAVLTPAPASALGTANDPQWIILNSLMSPQLGVIQSSGLPADAASTSASATKGSVAAATPAVLQADAAQRSPDLQLQMHLAMQAQMNLHRQMLTRKVEVSQHLLLSPGPAQPRGTVESCGPVAANATAPVANAWSAVVAPASVGPRETQPKAETATPSIAVATEPAVFADVCAGAASGLLGDFLNDAVLAPLESIKAEESDALDLYRWDRMDLSMELDDDDLFSFLKT